MFRNNKMTLEKQLEFPAILEWENKIKEARNEESEGNLMFAYCCLMGITAITYLGIVGLKNYMDTHGENISLERQTVELNIPYNNQ